MRNFADRLVERIAEFNNPTVMGLDPKIDYLPESLRNKWLKEVCNPEEANALALYDFNCQLIDAVCDIVPAIKPQHAYYEMYGIEGLKTLQKTIKYAQSKGMLVISDAKRNDIGATATCYAEAILGKTSIIDGSDINVFGSDAVTINGYLGIDGVKPFIDVSLREGTGIFNLVRTSNPSAGDIQDLILENGKTVYQAMAMKVDEWGKDLIGDSGFSSLGAVVGATWPEQAVDARKLMPNAIILVPGYGAQGAGPDSAVASFTKDGKGSIVNASRSLMCAWKKREDLAPEDFAKATCDEAIDMKNKLNAALSDRKYC
ncbi:MAG: orotidine-5'-phosphate decarboxylase [Clostridia bacterium]|nr:orotidine-5'-phosphate decarboxylase [Clostridia bacterium]